MRVLKAMMLCLLAFLLGSTIFAAGNKNWPKEVRFGIIPTESSSSLSTKYDALVGYLEKELNLKFKLFFASDYRGIIEALRFGKIEMAHLGPMSYVEATDSYKNCEPIVRYVLDNGSSGYRSCLIANAKTDIYSPEDGKGHTYAFNDPNSTSGYLVPMTLYMNEMKVEPEKFFAKVTFSGSHEASIMAVANGSVDMASTNIPDLKNAIIGDKIKENSLRLVWVSTLIPNDPFVVRKNLPASLKNALQKALIEVGTRKPDVLRALKWSGFIATNDSQYQPIRDLIKLKKALDAKKK